MRYCVKCGTLIDGSWKHCPSCGSKVKTESINDGKSGFIGFGSQSKIEKTTSKKEGNLSFNELEKKQRNVGEVGTAGFRFDGIVSSALIFLVFVFIVIVLYMQNDDSKRNETIANPNSTPSPTSPAGPFITKKEEFYLSKTLFISAGCKPEIVKDDYGSQSMKVPTGNIYDFPYDLSKNLPEMNQWGTSVDRALVFASAYEGELSDLTFELGLYPEMKKYRTKYNSYFSLADSIAKKLCYTNQPTDAQLKFSETAISRLQNEWEGFSTWKGDAMLFAQNITDENTVIAREYNDSLVPKCDEIKTNNPNYNIVKCTNIP